MAAAPAPFGDEEFLNTEEKSSVLDVFKKKEYTAVQSEDLNEDHLLDVEEFCRKLNTNLQLGLSQEEAEHRLSRDGPNVLTKRHETPKWLLFLKELFTGFGPLFWIASILCFISYEPLGGSDPNIYNLIIGCVLLFVLFFQAIFRFVQLQTASNLMDQFLSMMPQRTKVLRGGKWLEVRATDLVVGDVVRLSAGDKFPADVRAVEVSQAKMDKSSLTGENKPIRMSVEPTDQDANETRNLGYFGTNIVEGTATVIVYRTGDRTAMGNIAKLSMTTERNMTTLERDIYYFTILIAIMAFTLVLILVLYWVFYINVHYPGAMSLPMLITTCVAVIVAFIPEGLPVAVTATLTMVAKRMRRVNVLVKNLSIIETLGATTVICSDKTGTITQNKMSLSHLWLVPGKPAEEIATLHGSHALDGALDMLKAAANAGSAWVKLALSLGSLCNNAQIDEETMQPIGSSTECALLVAAAESLDVRLLRSSFPMLGQVPFNSTRKRQSNVHKFNAEQAWVMIGGEALNVLQPLYQKAKVVSIVKGASEMVIDLCTKCVVGDHVETFTPQLRERALTAMNQLADTGERVMGIGFKFLEDETIDPETDEGRVESDLIFIALVSLIDPPRDGVAESVNACHRAGIRVAMVTGDHPSTAQAIARKVNIFTSERRATTVDEVRAAVRKWKAAGDVDMPPIDPLQPIVVVGREVGTLTQDEWDYILAHSEFVFARTTPENKLEIVSKFQDKDNIVAVTGDGVNDAPALKKADIGIAMGIMGSEISKEAANVILMDDNFTTIVNGISQGRLLFDNLRKVICYLMPAGSFSEIVPVIFNMFLGIPLPLSSFLMLAICIGTDMIASLGLVYEKAESDIMLRPPRHAKKDHLVDTKVIFQAFLQIGVIEAVIAFFLYFFVMDYQSPNQVCTPSQLVFVYDWGTNATGNTTEYCDLNIQGQRSLLYYGQSAFFVSLVMTQIWNILTATRTRYASIFTHSFRPKLLVNIFGEVFIVICLIYIPFFNMYLNTAPVDYYCFLIPIAMGSFLMIYEETRKYIIRRYPKSCVAEIAW